MKESRLRLFPPFLMLTAGSIASIMTFYFDYELGQALRIILFALLGFYFLGSAAVRVISSFDRRNEEKRREEEALLMAKAAEEALEEMQE